MLLFHVLTIDFEWGAWKKNCNYSSTMLLGGVNPPVHSCPLNDVILQDTTVSGVLQGRPSNYKKIIIKSLPQLSIGPFGHYQVHDIPLPSRKSRYPKTLFDAYDPPHRGRCQDLSHLPLPAQPVLFECSILMREREIPYSGYS